MLQLYLFLEAVLKLSQRRQSRQRKNISVVRGAVIVDALLLAQVLEGDVSIVAGKSFRLALGILHSGHVGVGLALQLLDDLDARGGVHPQPMPAPGVTGGRWGHRQETRRSGNTGRKIKSCKPCYLQDIFIWQRAKLPSKIRGRKWKGGPYSCSHPFPLEAGI